jgi:hypothetical protein
MTLGYDESRATRLNAFMARRRAYLAQQSMRSAGVPSANDAAATTSALAGFVGEEQGLGDCQVNGKWYKLCIGNSGFGEIEHKGATTIIATPGQRIQAERNKRRVAKGKPRKPLLPELARPAWESGRASAPLQVTPDAASIAPQYAPQTDPAFAAPAYTAAPAGAPATAYAPPVPPDYTSGDVYPNFDVPLYDAPQDDAPQEETTMQDDDYVDPLTNPDIVAELQGYGYDPANMDLGFSFGKIFKSISKAVAPVLKIGEGIIGGVIGNTLGITQPAQQPPLVLPAPAAPKPAAKRPAPKPASSLGSISPAMLGIGALALILVLKKK